MYYRRIFLILGLLSVSFLFSNLSKAKLPADQGGEAVYQVLRNQGFLENYMTDLCDEVAKKLMAATEWSGYQINGAYRSGVVNIYLIDSHRLPEKNILANYNIDLNRHNIERNALTYENTQTIFIDTNHLKELIAYTMLYNYDKMTGLNALATIRVGGLNRFRELWDPALNPKLRLREIREPWLIMYRGMLAFLLGHEMGHIYLGKQGLPQEMQVITFTTKQDRDLHWACPDMLGPKYSQQQKLESQADNFAINLIGQVLFPDSPDQPRHWYELGAHMYLLFNNNNELLTALSATESQNIQDFMRLQLGPALFTGLLNQSTRSGKGSVHVFFPKTHPVTLRRAELSLGSLARSKYSIFYGESPPVETALLERLTNRACQELRQKYGNQ